MTQYNQSDSEREKNDRKKAEELLKTTEEKEMKARYQKEQKQREVKERKMLKKVDLGERLKMRHVGYFIF